MMNAVAESIRAHMIRRVTTVLYTHVITLDAVLHI